MKKVVYLFFILGIIFLATDLAYAYVNCYEQGPGCIRCDDYDAYEGPDNTCLDGGDNCIVTNLICGY